MGYWEKLLSVPKGISRSPLNVHLPEPCNREVRRIRIYDAVNIKSVFFVVSQLEEVRLLYLHIQSYDKMKRLEIASLADDIFSTNLSWTA